MANQMEQSIANAYVRRIKRGTITIDDVPDSIRDKVEEILNEQQL